MTVMTFVYLGAKITVILPRSKPAEVQRQARRKGLAPSVLIRVIVLAWLDALDRKRP